jgi:hypothetical protein
MRVRLASGVELTFLQAVKLGDLVQEMKERGEKSHWHLNECGCCLTLHGSDCAYVINSDGEDTLYPGKGCSCDD